MAFKWLLAGVAAVLAIGLVAMTQVKLRPPAPIAPPATSAPVETLTPDVTWRAVGSDSPCVRTDVGPLWAYVQSVVGFQGQGEGLALFLHNNTNMCGGEGTRLKLTNTVLTLKVVAGGPEGRVLARAPLPDPPAELAPGATVSLRFEIAPDSDAARRGEHLVLEGLPYVGGSGAPAGSTFQFPAVPAEATALHVQIGVTVIGCNSDGGHTDYPVGTGTVSYDFPLK